MGAYRELGKLPCGVSIADEFDERVEAARAAADEGEFDLYIVAQGGANVPLDSQTIRWLVTWLTRSRPMKRI